MGGEDRRGHARARSEMRVRILVPKPASGVALDISQSGMLLEMQRPPLVPVGKEVQVQFQLDRKQRPISARGEVIRHAGRTMMGIKFLMLPLDVVQAIAVYVESNEKV